MRPKKQSLSLRNHQQTPSKLSSHTLTLSLSLSLSETINKHLVSTIITHTLKHHTQKRVTQVLGHTTRTETETKDRGGRTVGSDQDQGGDTRHALAFTERIRVLLGRYSERQGKS